ncbi:MAG: aldo/keto reductase [Candidatus Hydrogenedentes bacterium]|nr:aldo/keto reductase [Candidatus Hydrogenedentota bacterium]
MEPMNHEVNRRAFLKKGVHAAAAAAALGSIAQSAEAARPEARSLSLKGSIPTRRFGKTEYTLPILAHGGSTLWGNEAKYYRVPVPSYEARVAMVRDAYDKGVRYFDTARIYGDSENIMGEALKDVQDDVYLATKVMVPEPEKVRESVETSLKTLQMDRVECVQIHGPMIEQLKFEGAMKLHEELLKLRDEGLFRFVGLTGHNAFEEMYKMIATGGFDTVLIAFGYFKRGYNTRHSEVSTEWRNNCIAKASELDMGILAMKVMGAWVYNHNSAQMVEGYDPASLKALPGAAIRWVLSDERVHLLNIGMSVPTDIDDCIATLSGNTTLTHADRALLADFSAKAYLHPSIQELPVV